MSRHIGKPEQFSRKETWPRVAFRFCLLYLVPLCLAAFLSLFYFDKYEPPRSDAEPVAPHAQPEQAQTVHGQMGGLVSELINERARAADGLHSLLTGKSHHPPPQAQTGDKPAKPAKPNEESSHGPQPLPQMLLKITVVVCISFLWFWTFLVATDIQFALERARGNRNIPRLQWLVKPVMIAGSLLPAIPFVLSMRGAYEPAVFVMALVAIFMATEHYGGLRESERQLEEKTTEITGKIGSVLNADGLAEWRAEIYERYSTAKRRVDAVIRYFDIDADWWLCAGSPEPWSKYKELCKNNPDSLLSALSRSEANIQFVNEFPMPFHEAESPGEIERAEYFRELLGMVFNLVAFETVREHRDEQRASWGTLASPFFPYARIILSHAPSWMHVIDDVVYQVIERGSAEDSTVRRLTQGAIDQEARVSMNEWARRNVRRFAHRGGPAEEYVCAVLRYQALKIDPDDDQVLNDDTLRTILNRLGMKDFLNLPNPEFRILELGDDLHDQHQASYKSPILTRLAAERLCTKLFMEFLEQRMSGPVLGVSVDEIDPLTVRHLIYEVL